MRIFGFLIQFFVPWNSYYLGVQFGNNTWFLFKVRRTISPEHWDL
jgi:hypothetical protein